MSSESRKVPFYIEQFERTFESWEAREKAGINYTLYVAYQDSKKIGHDLIDFANVIHAADVEAIVTTFRENNIKEFTISCRFSDLIDRLADFEAYGCHIHGLIQIKNIRMELHRGLQEISALKMVL